MPESIEFHIKNLQSKLQQLLKKHVALQKEAERKQQAYAAVLEDKIKLERSEEMLRQQVGILKASAGQMEGDEKKEFAKVIDQYIRSIDKCINILKS